MDSYGYFTMRLYRMGITYNSLMVRIQRKNYRYYLGL